ncbi:hypothetical protein K439DRAFT_1612447 [Ramaria rubella]|nr:hypothetical protein K439DRAFT_1612447 [Ramaria rubella]
MRTLAGLLLGFSILLTAADDASTEAQAACQIHLEPGGVVQGDVKIVLDGMCTAVSSYSVGLRFAERSREGVVLPESPTAHQSFEYRLSKRNDSVFEPWVFDSEFDLLHGVNKSLWESWQNKMKDPALWLAQEEERIGFETRRVIREGQTYSLETYTSSNECFNHYSGGNLDHNVEESFSILVPFTNYPPAFDMSFGAMGPVGAADSALRRNVGIKAADAEHIYLYFVDVVFANGTHHESPAGYTSFNAIPTQHPYEAETLHVSATRVLAQCTQGGSCPVQSLTKNSTPDLQDEFTLEVTFPNGRHVPQGHIGNVTIISHQVGSGLQHPLAIHSLDIKVTHRREWAARLAADDTIAETLRRESRRKFSKARSQVDNGTAFSTEAVTSSFMVPQNCYPTFSRYYQTTEVALEVTMEISSAGAQSEEYTWTPTKKSTEILSGSIPLFVYPSTSVKDGTVMIGEPTHYLEDDARAPIFVDPHSVAGLRLKTIPERDAMARISRAHFGAPASQAADIVKHRYYGTASRRGLRMAPYYVGDTWLRKVVSGGNDHDADFRLVVQAR